MQWRHVFLTLAAFAIALKVLLPTGLMVAAQPRNELPFPIVLCTGEGMVEVAPGAPFTEHGEQDEAPEATHDAPCAFAASGAAGPPPAGGYPSPVEFFTYPAAPPVLASQASPGRGLSGPPLPARGPPIQLI